MDIHIDCPCAGTPHAEGDTVSLKDKLDSVAGLAIKYSVAQKTTEMREAGQISPEGEITDEAISWLLVAFINQRYLIYGVQSWTLVDADGKKLPPTPANLRSFMEDHPAEAMQVGDEADSLYAEAVMLPLLKVAASSSRPGQTNGLTSPMKPSSTESNGSSHSPKSTRKPSSPSLTESSTTTAIAPTSTSSAGGDSSSASSASAGG